MYLYWENEKIIEGVKRKQTEKLCCRGISFHYFSYLVPCWEFVVNHVTIYFQNICYVIAKFNPLAID